MQMPKGFVDALGGGEDSGSAPESGTADESMLEQHLRAFKRALDGGNMAKAADCFRAAMTEANSDEEGPDDANDPNESNEDESY